MVALGAIALTGCFGSGTSSVAGPSDDSFGTVVIQAKTSNVNKLSKPGLGKASVISLDSLIVTAISNAATPDTVVVRLAAGENGFVSNASADQNISIELTLKALRSWTISAITKDANDSVVQTGSVAVNNLLAGQNRTVNLEANPVWAMYKAKFNFPDSIFSPTGLFGQKVNLSKIELIIDGNVVADLSNSFEADTDYEVAYDYVSVNATNVSLKVYGTLEGASAPWNAQSLLYSKTTAISGLSTTNVNNVSLNWVGPTGGAADLTVQIGKVGTYEIVGETPHEVLSKK
jgi:hypothetical protein